MAVFLCLMLFWADGCAHGKSGNKAPQQAEPPIELSEDPGEADLLADDDFFEDEPLFDPADIEKEKKLVSDPLYYLNKSMYHFNDKLYFWVLKPSATTYNKATPGFFRKGIRNFFNNLKMPIRFTSCLLQGKMKKAGSEVGRFLVNATLGFGGFIDTAEHSFRMKEADEDLGQVLGSWGIGNGFYLYLPLLGPSTLRDAAGTAGGMYLDPMWFYTGDPKTSLALTGLANFNSISFSLGNYEAVKSASLDPYAMIRDFYIEQRNKKIRE